MFDMNQMLEAISRDYEDRLRSKSYEPDGKRIRLALEAIMIAAARMATDREAANATGLSLYVIDDVEEHG